MSDVNYGIGDNATKLLDTLRHADKNRAASAESRRGSDAADAENARLREELLRSNAIAVAAQLTSNEIVRELAEVAAGRPIVRRLSDPGNRAARVAYSELREDEALSRLSGGTLAPRRDAPSPAAEAERKPGRRP